MTKASPSMLSVHTTALSGWAATFHEFLLRYEKSKPVVYGFVEGKTDPTFYRGFIEHVLPDGWEVELWPAGNKSAVLGLYADIDWRRFRKKRVCFFVDRDLSDLLAEKLPNDVNIYVTDGYSIENDVVRRGTVRRSLTEVFGFSSADHGELDQVCDKFEQELESFLSALTPLMAWILHWRQNKVAANLNDIYMQHLFECKTGEVHPLPNPRGRADYCEYIHAQCGVPLDPTVDISVALTEFRKVSGYRRFVRGKYLMWFLVEFCLSVYENASTFFPSLSRQPNMNVSISQSNGMQILGPRARIPRSLREFLSYTYCGYIESQAGPKRGRS